jgi:hypothetical protein
MLGAGFLEKSLRTHAELLSCYLIFGDYTSRWRKRGQTNFPSSNWLNLQWLAGGKGYSSLFFRSLLGLLFQFSIQHRLQCGQGQRAVVVLAVDK